MVTRKVRSLDQLPDWFACDWVSKNLGIATVSADITTGEFSLHLRRRQFKYIKISGTSLDSINGRSIKATK